MADFERPASEQFKLNNAEISTDPTGGGNETTLTPVQNAVAVASIKNFLPSVKAVPSTFADQAKIKAAINTFQAQIKNLKTKSATLSKTKGKTGKTNGGKAIAGQLTDVVGNTVPGIAKCLPAGTNLNKTTFNAAINSLEAAVKKMQELLKKPAETPPAPVIVNPATNLPAPAAAEPLVSGGPVAPPQTLINNMATPGLIEARAAFVAFQQAQVQPQKAVGGIGGREFQENVQAN